MIARCVWTLLLVLFALYAFWGNALGAGHLFNPFGILFLFFAAITWFKWDVVCGAFSAVQNESNIPVLRMGYKILQGLGAKAPADELPTRHSSSNHS